MNATMRKLAAPVALLIVAAGVPAAWASPPNPSKPIPVQYYGAPNQAPFVFTNPPLYPGGPALQQVAYNTAVLGRAASNIPPYLLGYNPYLQALNYGSALNTVGPYGLGGYPGGLGAGYYPGSTLATSPYAAGPYGVGDPTLSTAPYVNPYAAFDPYGGALRGLADVTTANANALNTVQKARVTMNQADQAAIQTRRQWFDELRYERMNTPTAEDLRIKDIEIALRRARNEPPVSEVTSGRSLNDLINHLAAEQAKGLRGPDIRLSEDLLRHINLTSGTNGNAGLLRNGGKLTWPLSLQTKEFEEGTKAISSQIDKAYRTAEDSKPIDPGTLKDLKAALDKMNELLDNANARMTPNDYIEAKRYLNMLGETYRALQDPKVGEYINNGERTAQGNTVDDFIKKLTGKQGLRIAPATPGDENYYRALHAALTSYDAGITQTTSAQDK